MNFTHIKATNLICTQVHQTIEPLSFENLKKKFRLVDLRIYDINVREMRRHIAPSLAMTPAT